MDCSTPSFPVLHHLQSLLKLMYIELVMSTNHPCRPLLILPSVFLSTRVCSNELALCIRKPKYWSFSFSISPSSAYSGLIFFRIDWFDLLAVQGTLKSLLISWLYTLLKKTSPKTPGTSLVAQMVKNPHAMQKTWVHPWVGKIPWRRAWQLTSVFLTGESPRTEKPGGLQPKVAEWDTTERLSIYTSEKNRAWTTHQHCSDQPGVN